MLKWLRGDAKPAPAATLGAIEIHRPWARQAVETPEQAGGFFTLTNKGTEPDRLVAASSLAAEKIEIHAIKVVGGSIDVELLLEAPGLVGKEVLVEERQRG